MIISLTGTPGVGKSSVSNILEKNYRVINLVDVAIEKGFTLGYDSERDSYIIDIERFERYIKETLDREEKIILESHLSHLVEGTDLVVVLRCNPKVLRERLKNKGWRKKKIEENVEAEILDIILSESIEIHGIKKVAEIDTSNIDAKKVAEIVKGLIEGKIDIRMYLPGRIDWLNYLMEVEDGS